MPTRPVGVEALTTPDPEKAEEFEFDLNKDYKHILHSSNHDFAEFVRGHKFDAEDYYQEGDKRKVCCNLYSGRSLVNNNRKCL